MNCKEAVVPTESDITLQQIEALSRGELGGLLIGDFHEVIKGIFKAYQKGRAVVVLATNKTLLHGSEFRATVSGQGGCVVVKVDPEQWFATDCPMIVEAARRLFSERKLSMRVPARREMIRPAICA